MITAAAIPITRTLAQTLAHLVRIMAPHFMASSIVIHCHFCCLSIGSAIFLALIVINEPYDGVGRVSDAERTAWPSKTLVSTCRAKGYEVFRPKCNGAVAP